MKLADMHGSGPCAFLACGFKSHLRHKVKKRKSQKSKLQLKTIKLIIIIKDITIIINTKPVP
jgi:hypothetical protein